MNILSQMNKSFFGSNMASDVLVFLQEDYGGGRV